MSKSIRSSVIALILLTATLLCIGIVADDTPWGKLYDAAKSALRSGDIDGGVTSINQALEEAKKTYGENSEKYVWSLVLSARLQTCKENISGAEEIYKKAIELSKTAFKADDPVLGDIEVNLANLYFHYDKKYEEAEKLYKLALDLFIKDFGPNDHHTTEVLEALIDLMTIEGKEDDKKKYEQQLAAAQANQ